MKFTREARSAVTIRHVEKGMVRIGEETYTENVILFRETIQGGWETNDIAQVGVEDLADLMAEKPEIVIFGTGWQRWAGRKTAVSCHSAGHQKASVSCWDIRQFRLL